MLVVGRSSRHTVGIPRGGGGGGGGGVLGTLWVSQNTTRVAAHNHRFKFILIYNFQNLKVVNMEMD